MFVLQLENAICILTPFDAANVSLELFYYSSMHPNVFFFVFISDCHFILLFIVILLPHPPSCFSLWRWRRKRTKWLAFSILFLSLWAWMLIWKCSFSHSLHSHIQALQYIFSVFFFEFHSVNSFVMFRLCELLIFIQYMLPTQHPDLQKFYVYTVFLWISLNNYRYVIWVMHPYTPKIQIDFTANRYSSWWKFSFAITGINYKHIKLN